MKKSLVILIFSMLLGVIGGSAGAYDYKVDDPYVSTIVGTPEGLEWDKLPEGWTMSSWA